MTLLFFLKNELFDTFGGRWQCSVQGRVSEEWACSTAREKHTHALSGICDELHGPGSKLMGGGGSQQLCFCQEFISTLNTGKATVLKHHKECWTTCSQVETKGWIPKNVSVDRPKQWKTRVEECKHVNIRWAVVDPCEWPSLTNKNNHLVYQFQLILCLQRVVTEGYKSDTLNLNIQ